MSKSNWIGQSIGGRYQIEELLGQGGMSSVYKATDPNLRRVVAIKMIHPHLSREGDFVRRFEEEAAAVAQLRHSNIIQVHDFDHDEGAYYMVLEFVPGETLQERLKRLNQSGRKMALDEVVKYMVEICGAVGYAHERGLIHRDLKPANVMLNVNREAILMDFGIAKIVGGQHHTATGAVIGTASYMSPEQIKSVEIDRRSDIYSLGVMLFEMVNGRPPFEAESAMTLMMMHVNDPVPDLRQLKPDLPINLIAVIEKSLSKDREQRFQSAAEMAAALQDILEKPDAKPVEGTYIEPPAPDKAAEGATYVVPPSKSEEINQGTLIEETPASKEVAMPPVRVVPQASTAQKKGLSPKLIAGGVVAIVALLCIVIGGAIFIPRRFSSVDGNDSEAILATQTIELDAAAQAATLVAQTAAVLDVATEEPPSATPDPTNTPTSTPKPTETSTPTITPSPTFPTDLYVLINNITIEGEYFIVDYETFGYQPQLPGTHIHFFFDTVPVENAGSPGSGPWILYGGPNPFSGYRVSERPASATQMCARVANSNHSLYDLESGNCFDLPE